MAGVRELRRRQRWLRDAIGRQIADLRDEQSISRRELARAANVDPAHLMRMESGTARASLEAIVAVADALGADVSVRLFEGRPAAVKDRFQAPIVEALLKLLAPRWRAELEVIVTRPARGVIDMVIYTRDRSLAIVVEVHSELRSLERTLRKLGEKAEGLVTLERFGSNVSRLLIVKSTAQTRAVAREFARSLETAFPVSSLDALRALRAPDHPWLGPSLLWATTDRGVVRFLERPRT